MFGGAKSSETSAPEDKAGKPEVSAEPAKAAAPEPAQSIAQEAAPDLPPTEPEAAAPVAAPEPEPAPEPASAPEPAPAAAAPVEGVIYVLTTYGVYPLDPQFPATKKIYQAQSRAAAIAFLQTQEVAEALFYIEVQTPEGFFGVDEGRRIFDENGRFIEA